MTRDLDLIKIELCCPFCKKEHFVNLSAIEYYNFIHTDKNIQDILLEKTPTEREQLISKICPRCQQQIFKEE